MRLRLLFLPVLLVALAGALLSACGNGSGPAPATGELVRSSVLAVGAQQDLRVHYRVRGELTATPAANAAPQTALMLAKPVKLDFSGGLSRQAVTAKGRVELADKDYDAEVLLGEGETFVKLLGGWYGDRTQGLGRASAGRSADPAELARKLVQLEGVLDGLLEAQVEEGPDVDGPTWQATGRCNAAGIARLAQQRGEPLNDAQLAAARALCPAVEVQYAVGADDSLPRRLRVEAKLDPATLAALSDEPGAASELAALELELTIELTKWGEPVRYSAPGDFRPMQELGGALLGLVMGAALQQPTS